MKSDTPDRDEPSVPPHLPVLESFAANLRRQGFSFDPATRLIAVQHLLDTNLALFQTLFDLGLRPDSTYILGKGYSTSARCVAALRGTGAHVARDLPPPQPGGYAVRRVEEIDRFWTEIDADTILARGDPVIVDDVGGRLLRRAAGHGGRGRIVGIEQTSSGIRRLEALPLAFPVVDLAQAAAKQAHESPVLAQGILARLDHRRPGNWPDVRAGVVGLGSVGRALKAALEARAIEVAAYAQDAEGEDDPAGPAALADLVARSDIIFGCTGRALFEGWDISGFKAGLILVSCSSEDVEFAELLRTVPTDAADRWPAPDCVVPHPDGEILILAGGYPLNFDDSGVSLPAKDIQLTTALTLAAMVTAAGLLRPGLPAAKRGFHDIPIECQDALVGLLEHSSFRA